MIRESDLEKFSGVGACARACVRAYVSVFVYETAENLSFCTSEITHCQPI